MGKPEKCSRGGKKGGGKKSDGKSGHKVEVRKSSSDAKCDGKKPEFKSLLTNNKKPDDAPKSTYILFCGNLAYDLKKEDLETHLKSCGKVTARLLSHKDTNAPKGCAFLEFENGSDLQKGLKYHNTPFQGRKLRIELTASGSSKETRQKSLLDKKKKLAIERKEDYKERLANIESGKDKELQRARDKRRQLERKGDLSKKGEDKPKVEIKYYEHPETQLEEMKTKFRLNGDGINYLKRQEAWVLEEIEKNCRVPDQTIKDPTGWVIKFGNQVKKERGTMIGRLHPVFDDVKAKDGEDTGAMEKSLKDVDVSEVKFEDDAIPTACSDDDDDDDCVMADGILSDSEDEINERVSKAPKSTTDEIETVDTTPAVSCEDKTQKRRSTPSNTEASNTSASSMFVDAAESYATATKPEKIIGGKNSVLERIRNATSKQKMKNTGLVKKADANARTSGKKSNFSKRPDEKIQPNPVAQEAQKKPAENKDGERRVIFNADGRKRIVKRVVKKVIRKVVKKKVSS